METLFTKQKTKRMEILLINIFGEEFVEKERREVIRAENKKALIV